MSLLVPQKDLPLNISKTAEEHHCQIASEGVPAVFKEDKCMGSVKLPPKPKPMPPAVEYCPDCGLVAGRIPLNPASFGKPFLGTSGSPTTFQGYTGVPTKIKTLFNGRSGGWSNFVGSNKQWARTVAASNSNPNMMILLSLSFIPQEEGARGAGLSKCAAGLFNDYFKAFGSSMKAQGVTSMIIRPGWEFTLQGWPWGTNNVLEKSVAYRGCFRNFVASVQAVYPENKFIYEWNFHQDGKPEAIQAAWPGNEFVDVVATDVYDAFYSSDAACRASGDCRWERRTQPVLNKLKSFADSVGKPIGISEWAIWSSLPPDTRGGGDNATFIRNLCTWVKDDANKVLYYSYFDELADGDHQLGTAAHSGSLAAFRSTCVGNPGNPHDELAR
ncbi:MAG: glycosyl hydrolase [Rickettsiales bacterium]